MQQLSLHSSDTAWLLGTNACSTCFAVLWLQLGQAWEGETLVLLQHSVSWWVPSKTPSWHPVKERSGRACARFGSSKTVKNWRNLKTVDCFLKAHVLCLLAVDHGYRCSSIPEESLNPACLKQFYLSVSELCYLVQSHRVQCSLKFFWKSLLYIFHIFGHVSTETTYSSQYRIC